MTRRMLVVLAALSLLHAPGALAQTTGQRNVDVMVRGYSYTIRLDTMALWNDVIATPAEAFVAIKRVVDSLKIPFALADSAHGFVFNPGFRTRTKFAGHPMVWMWRCGSGILGDYAETARMTIAYAIFIDQASDRNARVKLAFVAGAENVEGASRAPMVCATTGALEQEILKLAQLKVLTR
jgi:hypothetical protein